ncbi:uncharacterized protein CIMG_07755 [Coccidioides immitis RS]|uniref:CorA family metal ion transporter n=1 Tax=Coccidioides immitis (strain RS) TaxID=246410 RepID=J3K413_COCIM|nr:uncharacterized protein CIMG_07755 [Coccidioides immitis RS]EAS29009.3 hypothetical protein CIMG_07755 [Coccidioides immitis RS]TPX22829.1 hypothetical protein DIZ76_014708 [Coccidioides immitis]
MKTLRFGQSGRTSVLKPRREWQYVEIWDEFNSPAGFSSSEKFLSEEELLQWPREARPKATLRVLFSPASPDGEPPALGAIPRRTLQSITRAWNLPSLTYLADSREMSVCYTAKAVAQIDRVSGLVLRNNHGGHWFYCLAMSYNGETRETCALIIGLHNNSIQSLKMWLKDWSVHDSKPTHPLFLPSVLIEESLLRISNSLQLHRDKVWEVENDTGLHYRNTDPDHPNRSEALDLDRTIRKLTVLPGAISHIEFICQTQLRFLETLAQWSTAAYAVTTAERDLYWASMIEKLDLMKSSFTHFLGAAEYTHKRIQAQTQTIYTLLGQRDNHLNRSIAESQRRDSMDMRIIAVVTLLFLPGMFTATLCSTTFFNFQVGQEQKVLSSWIWIYGVATVLLTLLVLGGWVYWTHGEGRKHQYQKKLRLGHGNEMHDASPSPDSQQGDMLAFHWKGA